MGLILGSGRSPGYDNPLQYFCLGNPQNRGAWQATVHGIVKSGTRLKRFSTAHIFNYTLLKVNFMERQ